MPPALTTMIQRPAAPVQQWSASTQQQPQTDAPAKKGMLSVSVSSAMPAKAPVAMGAPRVHQLYNGAHHMATNPLMARPAQPFEFSFFLLRCLATYIGLAVAAVTAFVTNSRPSFDIDNVTLNYGNFTQQQSADSPSWVAFALGAAFVLATVPFISFAIAVRCRVRKALQGFLWQERYNTVLKVSYIMRPWQLPEMAWRTATCWLRRTPQVHIVGSMKCGTTALNAYLQQHPDVEASDKQFVKEVHFLSGRSVFRDNFEDCPWLYRSFFGLHSVTSFLRSLLPRQLAAVLPKTGSSPLQIDSTPQRLFLPWAARETKQLTPDAKIIICLRDPVKRALSNWQMLHARGKETRDISTALEEELSPEVTALYKEFFSADPISGKCSIRPAVRGCELVFPLLDFAYARRGMEYAAGVQRWVKEFGRENVLIVTQDDLCTKADETMKRVFKHVGLEPLAQLTPVSANASVGEKPDVAAPTLAKLRAAMAESNATLANEFGVFF